MKEKDQISDMEELVLWQSTLKELESKRKEIPEKQYLRAIKSVHDKIDKLLN